MGAAVNESEEEVSGWGVCCETEEPEDDKWLYDDERAGGGEAAPLLTFIFSRRCCEPWRASGFGPAGGGGFGRAPSSTTAAPP
jgi:hypothetical protein